MRHSRACFAMAVLLASASSLFASEPGSISANDNRVPAGTLRKGVLTVALEARVGKWTPQAENGGSILVQAFGEVGKALQIPGPLIRVRSGTTLTITLRNTLAEPLVVYGLHTRPGMETDTLHVAVGAQRSVTFTAGEPGTYYYWGTTTGAPVQERNRDDSQLSGALVVDPATGAVIDDRIFVLGLWFSPASGKGPTAQPEREIMVINGKSWPHTERIHHKVGETAHWRWINPTASSHPMHLHGFYFKVQTRGGWAADTVLSVRQQRSVATELMFPGSTMSIQWTAAREGNWVFHCHFAFHVSDELYLAPRNQPGDHAGHDGKSAAHSMAGLVLGIHVAPSSDQVAAKSSEEPRRMRLLVQQRTDSTFEGPRLGYALHKTGPEPSADSMSAPGPLLVLRRGQPIAITVVNRLKEPTAVHWHGIELESFPDGVPGWSGTPARIMPPITPQDSFVAEFVPPRSGTFIYHSHSNELGQILGGLVGPLVVTDNGELADNERVFLISAADTDARIGLVNGEFEPGPMQLEAGRTYRFRFINIGDWRVMFTLLDDHAFPSTRMIAKDGADLTQPVDGPLNIITGPGETADYEITLPAGNYRMEFKQQLSGWIIPLVLKVRPTK
ncbi:MAG TPA: multicopper oxidase domain-containing protein [Longimicrobiales bacterium]